MTAAHAIVAQACLGALLHLGEDVNKDILEAFPLAEYAAEHWVGHARFEDVAPPTTQDGMKRLFDLKKKRHLVIWVWIYDPVDPQRHRERSECPSEAAAGEFPCITRPFWGIPDVVKFLVVERRQDVTERGFPLGGDSTGAWRLEWGPRGRCPRPFSSTARRAHGSPGSVELGAPLDQASRSGDTCRYARVLLGAWRTYENEIGRAHV